MSPTPPPSTRTRLTKALLGFAIVATVVVVAIADVFNSTHLFNPRWPGHARFHIGMQFTTLLLVSLVSLGALTGPLDKAKAWLAALAPLTFWPGLLVAWFIPGTDVYATDELRQMGIPINIGLALLFIAVTLWGVWLASTPGKTARSTADAPRQIHAERRTAL
ncbi:hypothetical protein [Cystobacter ferrugineus]|uniref:Uncharacterized protein n=1 Tax=Cystobacter ferrugineus TaxID=83449 RepID=A0A1L9AUR5_9BACT|nr:hypothetical protein [Cystobacter ferrugineus]OJH33732.1 hypothetical protein BON30_47240 [Cystobacter ferrugineus]